MFAFILLVVSSFASVAEPIVCTTKDNGTVVIKMALPHPKEALVYRPDGEVVWLQVDGPLAHAPIKNFELLEKWVITPAGLGTIFIDGVPEAEPIIKEHGRYHLYIAGNTETEKGNTYFIECYFDIGE